MNRIDIETGLVRSLLHEQHPDLAPLALCEVDGGWDNQLWRLGPELGVRIPCTDRAPDLLRKEHQWLPLLAPRLPLPVPTPVRIGEPSARFPRPWSVARWVPGEPADDVPVSRGEQAADTLAEFLRALHQPAPPEAPVSPDRGVPLRSLARHFPEDLEPFAARVPVADLRQVWDEAVEAPDRQVPPRWLHADLHPANVVVADGTLCGVIDFGDLCAGDPATDLCAAWLLLPAGAAGRFFEAYGAADEATIRRARGWAVLRALGLIRIGQAWERGLPGGKRTWGPAGWATLERVLADR